MTANVNDMYIDHGAKLVARKDRRGFLKPENFRIIEWFRPPGSDHEDRNGHISGVYELTRTIVLLDLKYNENRKAVLHHTTLTPDEISSQYKNRYTNLKVHKAILNSPHFIRYDGTVMDVDGSPEEIVLFSDRTRNALMLIATSTALQPRPTCVVCDREYTGHGNNPYPVKDHGQCCNDCNLSKVIPVRINQID